MMKIYWYSFISFVVLAILFASCTSEVDTRGISVINPIEEIPSDFFEGKISEATFNIIGEGSGLPLSFPDTSLIIDSTLIIKFQNRSPIYFFDLEGNFKFLQKPTGQEALSFSGVEDICIFDKDHILISDKLKQTIYKYNFKSKQVVQEWRHYFFLYLG